jgi:hypothetical protein
MSIRSELRKVPRKVPSRESPSSPWEYSPDLNGGTVTEDAAEELPPELVAALGKPAPKDSTKHPSFSEVLQEAEEAEGIDSGERETRDIYDVPMAKLTLEELREMREGAQDEVRDLLRPLHLNAEFRVDLTNAAMRLVDADREVNKRTGGKADEAPTDF